MAKTVYEILIELEGNERAQQGLNALGQSAGLAGAALLAFQAKATQSAANYQESLAKVSTVSGDVAANSQAFDEALGQLSLSLDGNLSKIEASNAAYDVASAGFTDQADIMTILNVAQKTAIGGYSDIGTVADITTSILNAYGDQLGENLSVEQRAQIVTDQMIATQNKGKIVVGQYASQMGQLVPLAASAGVQLSELNGFISTATINALPANQAITGFRAAISALQVPTKAASDEAERLGVQFDAARLRSVGLEQILIDVANSAEFSEESFARLFGSVEANTFVQASIRDFSLLNENIVGMANVTGAATDAYETMAATVNQKARASLNNLSNAMIGLGQNTLIAIEPLIDILNGLITQFTELSPEMQGLIGSFVLVGGASLTLGGGLLMLAASFGSVITNAKAAYTVFQALKLAQFAKDTSALSGAWSLLNKQFLVTRESPKQIAQSLKQATAAVVAKSQALKGLMVQQSLAAKGALVFNANLRILLGTLGLYAIALGAVALAWVHYNNIQKENANNEILSGLQQTEALVLQTQRMAGTIRESGEALPQAEYDQWLKILTDANNEVGGLDETIAAFQRVQQGATVATEENTTANQSSSQSIEEKVEKIDEEIAAQQSLISSTKATYDAQLAMIEAVGASEEQLASERNRIRQEQYSAEIEQLLRLRELEQSKGEGQADQSVIDSITAQITTLEASRINSARETQETLVQLNNERLESEIDTQKAILEAQRETGEISELEYLNRLTGVVEQELQIRGNALRERLALAQQGSAEEARLLAEIAQLDVERAQQSNQLEEEKQRLIEETKQAQLEALDELIVKSQQLGEVQVNSFERLSEIGSIFTSNLSAYSNFAGTVGSVLSSISGQLEDENLSNRERANLIGVARDGLDELRGLGVDISSNQSIEKQLAEAQVEIEQVQLQLKYDELEIQQEQLQIEQQIQQLKAQGIIEENRLRLESGLLTEAESRQAQLDITLAQRNLELLNMQSNARERQLELQQRGISLQSNLLGASNPNAQGITISESDRLAQTGTNQSVDRFFQPAQSSGQGNQTALPTQPTPEALEKQAQATGYAVGQSIQETLGSTLVDSGKTNQAVLQATQQNTESLTNVSNGYTELVSVAQGIKQDTASIGSKLDTVNARLSSLPGEIASRIPRPSPPSSGR